MVTPLTATTVANPTELNNRFNEVDAVVTATQAPPAGMMLLYAGASAPAGWLLCDGSAVSRSAYAALFAVIGTTFGIGDGSTTFNLPDWRGRTPIGAGQGAGLTNRTLGQTLGEENHQLTIPELPAHHHGTNKNTLQANQFTSGAVGHTAPDLVTTQDTATTGTNQAHPNMQPSLALQFIIKV